MLPKGQIGSVLYEHGSVRDESEIAKIPDAGLAKSF